MSPPDAQSAVMSDLCVYSERPMGAIPSKQTSAAYQDPHVKLEREDKHPHEPYEAVPLDPIAFIDVLP